jgi:hypothetical protein
MNVIILPEVLQYLEDLVIILYDKGYFGFKESSRSYVIELFNDIKTTLPIRTHKPAPAYFNKYGNNMDYAVFRVRKSKHTQWYVFFTIYKEYGETIYLVRYIANNHTVAQYL